MRVLILLLSFLLLSLLPCSLMARTWHVPGEAPTIQAGIDSTGVGDTVLVAAGTYTGDGNRDIDFGGRDLVLKSEGGAETTIINCEGTETGNHRGFVFQTGESQAAVVQGFRIQNGYAKGSMVIDNGGGAVCYESSPTFVDCVFDANVSGAGGGIRTYRSSVSIVNCHFSGNTADDGGALSLSRAFPTIVGCSFSGNEASATGGAVKCGNETHPGFAQCQFSGNSAFVAGGGLYLEWYSYPSFEECLIVGNFSYAGGGVYASDFAEIDFTRCLFWQNSAWEGGGLLLHDCSPSLVNCTLIGNEAYDGGGISCAYRASPRLDNCIIALCPEGTALHCQPDDSPVLVCCDLFANNGGDWVGCIAGQYGINGNISEAPLFCDPDNGDFTISDISPCAPAQQPECGLIGALGVGCGPTATVPSTWGVVKSIFDLRGER